MIKTIIVENITNIIINLPKTIDEYPPYPTKGYGGYFPEIIG